MYNRQQLNALNSLEISDVDKKKLVDLSEIKVDENLPAVERLIKYVNDIKNPYCFLVNANVVKVEFSTNGQSLQILLKKHFIEQQNRTFE